MEKKTTHDLPFLLFLGAMFGILVVGIIGFIIFSARFSAQQVPPVEEIAEHIEQIIPALPILSQEEQIDRYRTAILETQEALQLLDESDALIARVEETMLSVRVPEAMREGHIQTFFSLQEVHREDPDVTRGELIALLDLLVETLDSADQVR